MKFNQDLQMLEISHPYNQETNWLLVIGIAWGACDMWPDTTTWRNDEHTYQISFRPDIKKLFRVLVVWSDTRVRSITTGRHFAFVLWNRAARKNPYLLGDNRSESRGRSCHFDALVHLSATDYIVPFNWHKILGQHFSCNLYYCIRCLKLQKQTAVLIYIYPLTPKQGS